MIPIRIVQVPSMLLIFLALLIGALVSSTSAKIPSICNLVCKSSINGTETFAFCESLSELTMTGRCCLNRTESQTLVVGIDLQGCGITEETFSDALVNMSSLLYISLEGNKFKGLSTTDFHSNTGIEFLSLPSKFSCPGSKGTWLNQSSDANSTYCFSEQNACDVRNVTCPSNSHCVHSGVDLVQCLCDEGFHGYKCLEQGTFPLTSFLASIILPTIALCILFFVTQRRYVIQQSSKVD
ncbi:all-trans retinoic acid-induced differentiation factor-like [Plakobranchus ocellatus]|uniref:All-trans retinoic acid-induced differentiation factor-like n=1 Tax=Plakobranchus ocellatus TaxID=259542 RepID=A0AAV4BIQ3_9GAST|nr:all-trans retinoic acid-induced differentiation factor-like [Plakobranchus ocellatus]